MDAASCRGSSLLFSIKLSLTETGVDVDAEQRNAGATGVCGCAGAASVPAQGLPLGAEVDLNKFKALFIDIGLAQALLGLDLKQWILNFSTAFANQGAIVEAFGGQEILAYSQAFFKKTLYY